MRNQLSVVKVHLTPKYFFRLNKSFWPFLNLILTFLQDAKVTKSGHQLFHDWASKEYGSIPGLMSQTYLHACLQRLNTMQISLWRQTGNRPIPLTCSVVEQTRGSSAALTMLWRNLSSRSGQTHKNWFQFVNFMTVKTSHRPFTASCLVTWPTNASDCSRWTWFDTDRSMFLILMPATSIRTTWFTKQKQCSL